MVRLLTLKMSARMTSGCKRQGTMMGAAPFGGRPSGADPPPPSHFLCSWRLVAACTAPSRLPGGSSEEEGNFRTPSLVHRCGEHRPVMSCTRLHGETAGPLPFFPRPGLLAIFFELHSARIPASPSHTIVRCLSTNMTSKL